MLHSIRTKITFLTLSAILISVLSIGGISIYSIKREGDRESMEKLTLICNNCQKTLNEYLDSIEQSVDMVSRYAGEELSSVELMAGGVVGASGFGDSGLWQRRDASQRQQLDRYLIIHTEKVETVLRSVANHTNGTLTYYYRINPELSTEVKGFWFSRKGDSEFVGLEPTDIGNFAQDDTAHVGWYYKALERGRPSWLDPYINENLDDTRMVSYVTPIYKANTVIGVIGMDISYTTLTSQIDSIHVYDSGYALLTDADGTILYHPVLPIGARLTDVDPAFRDIEAQLRSQDSSAESWRYRYGGSDKMMVFQTLSNGMKLLVVAPVREINLIWLRLMNTIIAASCLILAAFAALMYLVMNHLTKPLVRLTRASRLLAEGNYNVELDYDGNDEVGILTVAFQRLVNHLRIYISDLNSRAFQDAMTGVKNKGAYAIACKQLNDAICLANQEERTQPEFAIAMLDCNNLKTINDQYGHDKGDCYLQTACELICHVFAHSPVFRTGGDEFVVILQKEDYAARKTLCEDFSRMAEEINARAAQPWEKANIAMGLASYNPGTDTSAESVLHRADELMYLDKKWMKGQA